MYTKIGLISLSLLFLEPQVGDIRRAIVAGDSSSIPTVTSGFGTTPSIAGKDYAFRVTEGNPVGTSGVVAFNYTYPNAPVCSCSDETTVTAGCAPTATTTQVTLSQAFGTIVAGDKLVVLCRGY